MHEVWHVCLSQPCWGLLWRLPPTYTLTCSSSIWNNTLFVVILDSFDKCTLIIINFYLNMHGIILYEIHEIMPILCSFCMLKLHVNTIKHVFFLFFLCVCFLFSGDYALIVIYMVTSNFTQCIEFIAFLYTYTEHRSCTMFFCYIYFECCFNLPLVLWAVLTCL